MATSCDDENLSHTMSHEGNCGTTTSSGEGNDVSQRELMLSGKLHNPWDDELVRLRDRALATTGEYNKHGGENLRQLFGSLGEGAYITHPFHCDYGCHIHAGKNLYMNLGCVILDSCEVRIGDDVFMGPYVQIYTVNHPIDPVVRRTRFEYAKPITIRDNVWIGGGAIICPGVTIGNNSVIGAGSVVTKDVPDNVVAAGNPCRVIRPAVEHA
eukprot:TRINITY_DN3561_c0_g4_i1.p1 TRINITY_DN3561_c0_g4~~TRINITY_DN3561_c0_g4_i1.p1  ORF type:complete len:228 (+),score=29.51 TRINITY_DN3561_c0_g4_i1:50-685(+)